MKKEENLNEMTKMTDNCAGTNPTPAPPLKFRGGRNRWRMNMSLTSSGRVKAFTLAETLITLTILGVVAAITVPMLINKYIEATNRTKVRKAMATYEKALNQMIIDEDIKGVITAVEGFGIGECDISSSYFKPVEIITADNCRFKTADKIGYDITDITHPIFFLNDDYKTTDLDTANTGLRALAKDSDNNEVFGGVGNIQDGIVRINDKGTATDDDATILNKTYAFENNEKNAGGEEDIDASVAQLCPVCVDFNNREGDDYVRPGDEHLYFEDVDRFAFTSDNGGILLQCPGTARISSCVSASFVTDDPNNYCNKFVITCQMENGKITKCTQSDFNSCE